MELKHNKTDYAIYSVCLAIIVALLIAFLGVRTTPSSKANVYYDNKLVYTLDLNKDETWTMQQKDYPLLLADLVIEVKDHAVRVKDEESPKHYCSILGYQSEAGTSIICAPNSVKIVIEGDNAIDYQPGGVS